MNENSWKRKISKFVAILCTICTISGVTLSTVVEYIQEKKDIEKIILGIKESFSKRMEVEVDENIETNDIENIYNDIKKEYNNDISISFEYAPILVKNEEGEYVPAYYTPLELKDNIKCYLRNDKNKYLGNLNDNKICFSNINPGHYQICFEDSEYKCYAYKSSLYDYHFVAYDESEYYLDVEETTKENPIIYMTKKETEYSNFEISDKMYRNIEYEFRDEEAKYDERIKGTFITDDSGKFYFLVDWEYENISLHIHEKYKNTHISIEIDKENNGKEYI